MPYFASGGEPTKKKALILLGAATLLSACGGMADESSVSAEIDASSMASINSSIEEEDYSPVQSNNGLSAEYASYNLSVGTSNSSLAVYEDGVAVKAEIAA